MGDLHPQDILLQLQLHRHLHLSQETRLHHPDCLGQVFLCQQVHRQQAKSQQLWSDARGEVWVTADYWLHWRSRSAPGEERAVRIHRGRPDVRAWLAACAEQAQAQVAHAHVLAGGGPVIGSSRGGHGDEVRMAGEVACPPVPVLVGGPEALWVSASEACAAVNAGHHASHKQCNSGSSAETRRGQQGQQGQRPRLDAVRLAFSSN